MTNTNRELTEWKTARYSVKLDNGEILILRCRWMENAPGTESDLIERIEAYLTHARPGRSWVSMEETRVIMPVDPATR